MDLSAIIKAVLAPQAERSGASLGEFQPGDRLTGRVLQLESDGRVLVDLGKSKVLAQMNFAVRKGQTLRLAVIANGPPLHLQVDPPPVRPSGTAPLPANLPAALDTSERRQFLRTMETVIPRLLSAAQQSAPARTVRQALLQLKAAFDPLPLDRPVEAIAQWLKQSVENNGSLFEKRFAELASKAPAPETEALPAGRESEAAIRSLVTRDVKPNLMVLRQFLREESEIRPADMHLGDGETDMLRRSVDKMLRHVEQQQERAVVRSREGEPLQMFGHVLPMGDDRPPVRLKIYYPRKTRTGDGEPAHRIALMLDLDRLGSVRGDIAAFNGLLQVRLWVQDQPVCDRFQARLEEIETALRGSFSQVRVDVAVSREQIAAFDDEDRRESMPGRIDIQV